MASEVTAHIESDLLDSFNEGREDEARAVGAQVGVWSAILDSGSCDFCRWADGKAFLISTDHPMPPVHFGCRCIIAYTSLDEVEEGELEDFDIWEEPPDSVFPIGRKSK